MASVDQLVRRVASLMARETGSLRRRPDEGMDDAALARKVETVLFLDAAAPRGRVKVSALDGVIELRGEVRRRADMKSLEAHARAIPAVRDVRNRLHLQKTPSA